MKHTETRFATILVLVLVAGVAACDAATGPDNGEQVAITLAVSGGFAGVNWQYTVDGSEGRIVGGRCDGPVGCDWEPGQVLGMIDPADVHALANEFFAREFFDGRDDYGSECCDQFDYVLSYRDADDERSVRGSDGTLPNNINSLILLVQQFVTNARG